MLNKKRSAGRARLRLLYVLPLTGGMLCASTFGFTKDYALVDLYAKKNPAVPLVTLQDTKPKSKQDPKAEKKKIYPIESVYDTETGNDRPIKLIVINGKISKAQNFSSVSNFDQVKELNSSEAVAKYGKRASKGALEFTGKNTGISIKFPPPLRVKTPPVPPTPPKSNKAPVKFPPPATPLPKKKNKTALVKFPPPPVIKDPALRELTGLKAARAEEPVSVSFSADIIQPKVTENSDAKPGNQIRIEEPAKIQIEGNGNELNKINITAPKKDALNEVNIAIKKNITKEIEQARAAQQKKKD